MRLFFLILCLLCRSGVADLAKANDGTLRALSGNSQIETTFAQCHASYRTCENACFPVATAQCLDYCVQTFRHCAKDKPRIEIDPGSDNHQSGARDKYVGKFDRSVKSCESYRKAALGVEMARQEAWALFQQAMKLMASPNPEDKKVALALLELMDDEFKQAAEDAIRAEQNFAQFHLLTKTRPGDTGKQLSAAGKVIPEAKGPGTSQEICDKVASSDKVPASLQEAFADTGIDEEEIQEMMAEGKISEAAEMIRAKLSQSVQDTSPSPAMTARAEEIKKDILAKMNEEEDAPVKEVFIVSGGARAPASVNLISAPEKAVLPAVAKPSEISQKVEADLKKSIESAGSPP